MHRDLKPENLILQKDDSLDIKLADFGLAEHINKNNQIFVRCGTPGYVAPEVLHD
jgi:serine/threonine protein kinase